MNIKVYRIYKELLDQKLPVPFDKLSQYIEHSTSDKKQRFKDRYELHLLSEKKM